MTRENVDEKGRRYLVEGRIDLVRVDKLGELRGSGHVHATCRGDSGESYDLGFDPANCEWRCTCPARGRCAHLVALQLVVRRPTRGART